MTSKPRRFGARGRRLPLSTTHSALAAEWVVGADGVTADDVSAGSGYIATWFHVIASGERHEWPARVANRTAVGHGCAICAGKLVTAATSLLSVFPEIAEQWHPTRNLPLEPVAVSPASHKKVWWQHTADDGTPHVWTDVIGNRTGQGRGCAVCAGRQVQASTSFGATYPDLATQWHHERNGALTPLGVTPRSHKKVWWQHVTDVGTLHEWPDKVQNRTLRKAGCLVCSGYHVPLGMDLAALHPDLAREWDVARNGPLPPSLNPRSTRAVWWRHVDPRGGEDHQWRATVVSRSRDGRRCKKCLGLAASDTNNLALQYPSVAQTWHPELNGSVRPTDVTTGSDRKVHWQHELPDGSFHTWRSPVSQRVQFGCPDCSLAHESRIEVQLWHELAELLPLAARRTPVAIPGARLTPDILIPAARVCIEYDGARWHAGRDANDADRNARLEAHGWRVVRLRCKPLELLGQYDLSVSPKASAKALTNALLRHLAAVDLVGLTDEALVYLAESGPRAASKAERYLAQRLAA